MITEICLLAIVSLRITPIKTDNNTGNDHARSRQGLQTHKREVNMTCAYKTVQMIHGGRGELGQDRGVYDSYDGASVRGQRIGL